MKANKKQVRELQAGQAILFSSDEEQQALAAYEQQRLQLEESDEEKSMEDAVALVYRKQNLLQMALSSDESEIRPFKQLCDLWCAVWFWPVDAKVPPPTTLLYRDLAGVILKRPNQFLPQNAGDYLELAEKIATEQHFFHWELEFPEVWCDHQGSVRSDGGFDAIVGNPPWGKVAPNSKEFWSNYLPLCRALGKQAAVRAAEELRADPAIDMRWRRYFKLMAQQGALFKQENLFTWQGKGQINTYKLFTEQMLRLTRMQGTCSLVLPSSMYTDEGGTTLRRLLFFQQQTRFVLSVENRGGIFPIDSRFKVVLFSGRKTQGLMPSNEQEESSRDAQAIDCLFLVGKDSAGQPLAPSSQCLGLLLPQLSRSLLHLPTEIIKKLAPDTLSLMEFKNQREIDLVMNIYATFPSLGEHHKDAWNVSFMSGIHMTNESHLFREGAQLKLFGATLQRGRTWETPPDSWYEDKERANRYIRAERAVDSSGALYLPGELDAERVRYIHNGYLLVEEAEKRQALPIVPDESYIPLYEGRMVHQFDHAAKTYVRGSGRSAEWHELSFNEKEIIPHYFVARRDCAGTSYHASFCGVTGQTNERSLLTAMIPSSFPCGNSVPTVSITPDNSNIHLLWVALTNSFVADWLLRLRVSYNINFFVLESLALPRLKVDSQEAMVLIQATVRLTCVTPDCCSLARGNE